MNDMESSQLIHHAVDPSAFDRGQSRRVGEHPAYTVDNGLTGHGQPAVTQNGMQFGLLDGRLESQQRSQLSVAILLYDEYRGVIAQETLHLESERKRLDAQVIDVDLF